MSILIAQQDEAIDTIQATAVDVEANTRAGYTYIFLAVIPYTVLMSIRLQSGPSHKSRGTCAIRPSQALDLFLDLRLRHCRPRACSRSLLRCRPWQEMI